ncbi:hypothetical protein EV363DRAFT_630656 [Boletus edulis]|nr:hypothetical protein EV363DRAFT_630656 [Boletus edulis]
MAHDESRSPSHMHSSQNDSSTMTGSLKHNDTQHLAFGFGRRMCVGRHFTDASVWTVTGHGQIIGYIQDSLHTGRERGRDACRTEIFKRACS